MALTVPARAKVYSCQAVQGGARGIWYSLYFGQAYHNRGIIGGLESASNYIPNDNTTGLNVALWDPAAEGQTAARVETPKDQFYFPGDGTTQGVQWSTNVAYTWDLQAIQDAYGPISEHATVVFTVVLNSEVGLPGGGEAEPLRLRMMWGRRLAEPELGAAPDHTLTDGLATYYYSSPYAWRDPGTGTAGSPEAWAAADADVTSPSTYFPNWSTLMDFGNGVPGQVPRIPRLPIEPLGGNWADSTVSPSFQLAGHVETLYAGTVEVPTIPLVDAADGRWLMLWIGHENDYIEQYARTGGGAYGFADLSVTATLNFGGRPGTVPPLQQAARLIGNAPLLQRSREVRTQLLTARGRF